MAELYERFPMLADKRRAAARTLSGGQRQILAMAIALMNAPDLLLLDEPTAGLSPRAAEELFGTILAPEQDGRGDPDGRAERAGGAVGVGARLCAGAGPAGARGQGRRPGRRSDGPRSLSRRQGWRLCSVATRTSNKGTGTSHDNDPHRPPRRAGGRRRRRWQAPPSCAAQADPIKLATLTPLTGAGGPYGPVMAKAPPRWSRRSTRRAACWAAASCW